MWLKTAPRLSPLPLLSKYYIQKIQNPIAYFLCDRIGLRWFNFKARRILVLSRRTMLSTTSVWQSGLTKHKETRTVRVGRVAPEILLKILPCSRWAGPQSGIPRHCHCQPAFRVYRQSGLCRQPWVPPWVPRSSGVSRRPWLLVSRVRRHAWALLAPWVLLLLVLLLVAPRVRRDPGVSRQPWAASSWGSCYMRKSDWFN